MRRKREGPKTFVSISASARAPKRTEELLSLHSVAQSSSLPCLLFLQDEPIAHNCIFCFLKLSLFRSCWRLSQETLVSESPANRPLFTLIFIFSPQIAEEIRDRLKSSWILSAHALCPCCTRGSINQLKGNYC